MSQKSEMHRLNVALDEADEKLDELANRVDSTRKLLDTLHDISDIRETKAQTADASSGIDCLNDYVIDLMSDVFTFAAETTHGMPLKGELAKMVADRVGDNLKYMGKAHKRENIGAIIMSAALGFFVGFAGVLFILRVYASAFRAALSFAEKLP